MQMTSDASRLVRPGAVAQWSAAETATYQYCQVAREDYDASSRCINFHRAAGCPARAHPLKGSSRVKGNFHARFLGGCGRVNRLHLPGGTEAGLPGKRAAQVLPDAILEKDHHLRR